jgi:hypothetical protein
MADSSKRSMDQDGLTMNFLTFEDETAVYETAIFSNPLHP